MRKIKPVLHEEFNQEMTRLANHFGHKQYSPHMIHLLWREFEETDLEHFRKTCEEAIATRPVGRPPLRDDFKEIAKSLGVKFKSVWSYFEVDSCRTCGGVGWHYAFRDGKEGIVACDSCASGKNLQLAPKPHINFTLRDCIGAVYSRPGRETTR